MGAETANADPFAKRKGYGLADNDAGILGRVVIIDMQIALGLDLQIHQRMATELVQHMVEKTDTRCDFGPTRTVEIELDGNGSFLGLALQLGLTHGIPTLAGDDSDEKPCYAGFLAVSSAGG